LKFIVKIRRFFHGCFITNICIQDNFYTQKELELLNPERPAETVEDFDRLLMSSPNSSEVWLRYMALFVQNGELAKARLVAERALTTIEPRFGRFFASSQEMLDFSTRLGKRATGSTFGSPC